MRPAFCNLAAWTIATSIVTANARAEFRNQALDVTLTAAARPYCHIVRFPQGWKFPTYEKQVGQPLFLDAYSDYEFRITGVLTTQFLVAGFTEFVGHNYYTTNRYKVDLSNPAAAIVPVSLKAWESAAVVPFARNGSFPPGRGRLSDTHAEFHGFRFSKTGDFWAEGYQNEFRLSPDQAWLVLQSSERSVDIGPGWKAEIFFDFFNANTGAKLFSLEGTFTSNIDDNPAPLLRLTGWVTERYFAIPLGRHKERCVVCDFGGANRP